MGVGVNSGGSGPGVFLLCCSELCEVAWWFGRAASVVVGGHRLLVRVSENGDLRVDWVESFVALVRRKRGCIVV